MTLCLFILLGVASVVIALGFWYHWFIKKPLQNIVELSQKVAVGDLQEEVKNSSNKLLQRLGASLNKIIQNQKQASEFTTKIGEGKLEEDFQPLGSQDKLGYSLIDMRDKLKKVAAEDKERNWATEGLARFVEILRKHHDDIEVLSDEIIHQLVHYAGVNQGGIFILNNTVDEKPFLELTACFAYGRKKYLEKKIDIGQGLLGQAFLEANTIHITEVPKDYVEITSGLGESTPTSILIVPLKINDKTEGLIELASFDHFQPYEIRFIEKVAESIASTIIGVKSRQQMQSLLDQSREQTERMRRQEADMRKNNEELASSQEEMRRQQKVLQDVLGKSRLQEASLTTLINNTEDQIMAIDRSYNLTLFNYAFKSHFASQERTIEIGVNALEVFGEKYREEFKREFDRALDGYRFKSERKMGSKGIYRVLEINYSPIRTAKGDVTGVSVFFKDITEYIKKNEKIRQSQQEALQKTKQLEHTKEAVNRSGVATVEFDMDGHILDANSAYAKMLGYGSPMEVIGKKDRAFVTDQYAVSAEYKQFWIDLSNGIEPNGQYQRKAKDGKKIWISGSYNVVKDANGKPIMVIGVAFNITDTVNLLDKTMNLANELKSSEKEINKRLLEIEREKMKNEAILQGCVDGVVSFNEEGKIEFFNKAAEDIFATNSQEVLGKSITKIVNLDMQQNNDNFTAYVDSLGHQKELDIRTEASILTATGEEIDVLMTLTKAKLGSNYNFTIFIQKISVELF